MNRWIRWASTLAIAVPAAAQLPSLRVPAIAPILPGGSQVIYSLTATAGQSYAILTDLTSGPNDILGQRFSLGFSSAMLTLETGTTTGFDLRSALLPGNVASGVPIYLQAAVLDPSSPNGVFRVSNGESLIPIQLNDRLLVERFDDPVAEGFEGNFDPLVRDRVQGGTLRRRVHSTIDPQGVPFRSGVQTPLNPNGNRSQVVYRPIDLGSAGEEELVVAVRWKPASNTAVFADAFSSMEILMSHSPVQPDYTIDPFTALPSFPNSGLNSRFVDNYPTGTTPASVYRGSYAIDPNDRTLDGYMPYPAIQPFAYDGVNSLLLEFQLPQQAASGINGQQVYLLVGSSQLPAARNVAAGSASNPVDPATATTGRGDNAMYDYQIEFLRVKTTAQSPWRFSTGGADYSTPFVASAVPPGTTLSLAYRGADDATGTGATAWSSNIDVADGKSHLQYRVEFVANTATSAVPSIDSLVIPYR